MKALRAPCGDARPSWTGGKEAGGSSASAGRSATWRAAAMKRIDLPDIDVQGFVLDPRGAPPS